MSSEVVSLSLSPAEQKVVEGITQKKEEAKLAIKTILTLSTQKKEIPMLFVVGSRRFFMMKPNGKGVIEAHFMDLLEVVSTAPDELVMKFRTFTVKMNLPAPTNKVPEILALLWCMFYTTFPAPEAVAMFTAKFTLPPERLEQVKALAQVPAPGPCGSFSTAYHTMCDWLGIPVVAELTWDMDNLYSRTGFKDFDVNAFRRESISLNDIKPLTCALQYNNWFTTLNLKDFQLNRDGVVAVASVLRLNRHITKLVVSGCGISKETVEFLLEALVANKSSALTYLDLSSNPLEDKGLSSFGTSVAQMKIALNHLDISNCGGGRQGTSTALEGLTSNIGIVSSLTYLNLSNNNLFVEGSAALAKFIGTATALTTLNVSGSSPAYDIMKLSRSQSLRELDASNFHLFTGKTDTCGKFSAFLKCCERIEIVSLAKCQINLETLQALTTPDSKIMSLTSLNLSENDFGEDGIIHLCEVFSSHPALSHLSISKNFSKRTKVRGRMMTSLIQLIESDCPLTSLELEGNARGPLRGDLVPFLFSLIPNKTLTHLNISGNGVGDACAAILGRVLQANNTLKSLQWDDNLTTTKGFQYFARGLASNATLSLAPQPALDVSKEIAQIQPNYQLLLDTLAEIALYLSRNSGGGIPQPEARPAETSAARPKKVLVKKPKPLGIDTLSASKLFTQLEEFMSDGDGLPPMISASANTSTTTSSSSTTSTAANPAVAPLVSPPAARPRKGH
ncbi:myosin-I binding protein [Pelomyxa schiedti]|nr:myosin-I binding protein [Pelomyxa schiedti]